MLVAAGAVVLVAVVLIISQAFLRRNRSKNEADKQTRAVFCLSAQRHEQLVETTAAPGTGAAVPEHSDQIRADGTDMPLLT